METPEVGEIDTGLRLRRRARRVVVPARERVRAGEKYADKLIQELRAMKPADLAQMQPGTLLEWIHESYRLAVKNAYGKLGGYYSKDYEWKIKDDETRTGVYILPQAYYDANRSVMDSQLRRGGVRLAQYLNRLQGK